MDKSIVSPFWLTVYIVQINVEWIQWKGENQQ